MSRNPILYLKDILNSCEKISRYINNLTFQDFINDDRTYDAVIRNLEVIGEAAKNTPEEIQQKFSFVEWRAIAALRNVIAHEYFGLKDEIIWDIIKNKTPLLQKQIEQILTKNTN